VLASFGEDIVAMIGLVDRALALAIEHAETSLRLTHASVRVRPSP
jgi:hypothetical protein